MGGKIMDKFEASDFLRDGLQRLIFCETIEVTFKHLGEVLGFTREALSNIHDHYLNSNNLYDKEKTNIHDFIDYVCDTFDEKDMNVNEIQCRVAKLKHRLDKY